MDIDIDLNSTPRSLIEIHELMHAVDVRFAACIMLPRRGYILAGLYSSADAARERALNVYHSVLLVYEPSRIPVVVMDSGDALVVEYAHNDPALARIVRDALGIVGRVYFLFGGKDVVERGVDMSGRDVVVVRTFDEFCIRNVKDALRNVVDIEDAVFDHNNLRWMPRIRCKRGRRIVNIPREAVGKLIALRLKGDELIVGTLDEVWGEYVVVDGNRIPRNIIRGCVVVR